MKKRISSFLLTAVLAFNLLPAPAEAITDSPAVPEANGQPYCIMVNRKMSTVTVYGLDENGCYTVPVRAMLCSTGTPEHATPKGSYAIGRKHRWHAMMGGVYAQYLSQFYNDCLFHSVCYAKPSPDTLIPGYYDSLGKQASHGCVRLQTEDAKWIYDNCGTGTRVKVFDADTPGALGQPERMIASLRTQEVSNWDPTDPAPENPWAGSRTSDIALSAETIRLSPGETAVLGVQRLPEGTTYPTLMFSSDNSSVAVANGGGTIRATGLGHALVTVQCGSAVKLCEVFVTNDEVPFYDVAPDTWFYDDVMYLYRRGLISGNTGYSYAPDAPLLQAEAMQLLCNFEGKPFVTAPQESNGRMWYDDALDWANAIGISNTTAGEAEQSVTKQTLIELLYRYDVLRASDETVKADDADETMSRESKLLLSTGPDTESIPAEESIESPPEIDQTEAFENADSTYSDNSTELDAFAAKETSETADAESTYRSDNTEYSLQTYPEYEIEFSGSASSDAHADAVHWALSRGLLIGDEEGALALGETINRAQMASLLHRYCVLQGV